MNVHKSVNKMGDSSSCFWKRISWKNSNSGCYSLCSYWPNGTYSDQDFLSLLLPLFLYSFSSFWAIYYWRTQCAVLVYFHFYSFYFFSFILFLCIDIIVVIQLRNIIVFFFVIHFILNRTNVFLILRIL